MKNTEAHCGPSKTALTLWGVVIGSLAAALALPVPARAQAEDEEADDTGNTKKNGTGEAAPEPQAPSGRENEMPGNQKITWEMRRQVPFVRNGGVLNRKETAAVLYVDGDLFPPAAMVGIQRGINYWLSAGLDVGGDLGVFQALLRIKMEMARTRSTNFFFWGWHVRTGYKYVHVDFTDTMSDVWNFDDNSWILTFENTFALRFGKHRRRALYLNSIVYGDFDLRGEGRQIDVYVYPATLGFETILGRNWNFFLELGVIISINGWEVADKVIISKNGDVFPSGSIGFAYRFGGVRTALPENRRDPESAPMR